MLARRRFHLPFGRILAGPFLVRRRDVEHRANISYGDAGKTNLLDIYRPRSHPSGRPILVHLHGGAFTGGRKDREARPLLYRLASQGWLCISANYRLSPAAKFPDQLIDAKKVIAWVRDAPPFFVAHGDHDTRVPVEAARRFVDGLRATSSNPVVYAELPGAQHAFDLFHSIRFETVVNAVEAFTASVRSLTGERSPQRA